MNATQQLHGLGQSLWLDYISRTLVTSGELGRYIKQFSVTGMTSNPTIFDHDIRSSAAYDDSLRKQAQQGKTAEAMFFEVALEDLRAAADLFRPAHDASGSRDGWVSLEVSPLLADDTASTIRSAALLHGQAQRPNLFVKIPGTPAGIPAIEESVYSGVPINVTLLFSREQYVAAAEAYLRGIERRLTAGRDPRVASVASLFVSRWDVAVKDKVPAPLRNRLGIAVAMSTYRAYRELLVSARWRHLAASGAITQRLLWASTGTKDPGASDVLYIEALVAPDTINTMPEQTLLAFANHGRVGAALPMDGGNSEEVLGEYRRAGIDLSALAEQLQREGTAAFTKSWRDLMRCIAGKTEQLVKSAQAR